MTEADTIEAITKAFIAGWNSLASSVPFAIEN